MKKRTFLAILALTLCFAFAACGETEEPIDPNYTGSSIVITSLTEIAGEKPDSVKEDDTSITYIYEVKDGKVGAAAYNLYKDYLDANFTYSSIDSTYVAEGFCAVYYAANDGRIEYTETVNEKDGSYMISVCVPK